MNYFNYFTEIEETFIRRRGRHLLLSPLDWALIESWKEREIPLRIILRGVENVFDAIDSDPGRSSNVKSLSYCRNEIESLYSHWRETRVGKGAETGEEDSRIKNGEPHQPTLFSDPSIKEHLDKVIGELRALEPKSTSGLQGVLDSALEKLEIFRANYSDAEALENELGAIEASIDKCLLEGCDPKLRDEIEMQVDAELDRYAKTMEPSVFQRTRELMLQKRLRENARVPRLSLFYL